MTCPKCGGKVRVVDVFNTKNNEVYRQRTCDECKHEFYTIEYEVEYSEQLMQEIRETDRWKKRRLSADNADTRNKALREFRKQAYSVVCDRCKDDLCDGLDKDCRKIQKWVDRKMKNVKEK